MKCPCEAYVGTSRRKNVCTLYKSSAVGKGKKGWVINGSLGRCRYKGQRVSQPHSVPPRHMQTRTSR